MIEIPNFESRMERIESLLTEVAQGKFDQSIEIIESEDSLGNLEMGINFLIMDLRNFVEENRKKEESLLAQQKEMAEKLETIQRQQEAIRELSTPVMEVWEDVLVLPIVGVVDTKRSLEIMNNLLEKIVESQARCIILDITGVEVVDTRTADYLLKVISAARLLGGYCVVTGINPAVAQTLVEIGAELTEVKTLRNLKAGLLDCIRFLDQDPAGKGSR